MSSEKEVKVIGMHCPSCVAAVELSLTDVDGIDEAKASLDDSNVIIKYDASKVSDEDIVDAVEEVGFKVE